MHPRYFVPRLSAAVALGLVLAVVPANTSGVPYSLVTLSLVLGCCTALGSFIALCMMGACWSDARSETIKKLEEEVSRMEYRKGGGR